MFTRETRQTGIIMRSEGTDMSNNPVSRNIGILKICLAQLGSTGREKYQQNWQD
ncbi:MAG: hypothetical protein JW874_05070 [Spirochaetales bacterium]|nr:hypothetical protein [Spirochaetales bacterium]